MAGVAGDDLRRGRCGRRRRPGRGWRGRCSAQRGSYSTPNARRVRRGRLRRGWCRSRTSGRTPARRAGCRWRWRGRRSRAASSPGARSTRGCSGGGVGRGAAAGWSATPDPPPARPRALPSGRRERSTGAGLSSSPTDRCPGVRSAGWVGRPGSGGLGSYGGSVSEEQREIDQAPSRCVAPGWVAPGCVTAVSVTVGRVCWADRRAARCSGWGRRGCSTITMCCR